MSRRERVLFGFLLVVTMATLAAFLVWWFGGGHIAHNFTGRGHLVDVALFIALSLVFGHRLFMDLFLWVVTWGMRPEVEPPAPPAGLRVAFVTTFVPGAEPAEMLLQTLPAMLAADYPHDVWLLDEGDDPAAKQICHDLGVHHFSRAGKVYYQGGEGRRFASRTKGGNHNAWYDAHGKNYDIVAQIDTDFVPRNDFLTKTLGHFADPEIAWVGTPQVYGNGAQSLVARGAGQQLLTFYGPILRGFGSRKMCLLIGANHVVRVAALRSIGHYSAHLTEDLLTGMRLHAAGWKSTYVAEPLAIGEGPVTWTSFFRQQERWAFGCMDILRSYSLGLVRKMTLRQAALYLALQQYYFTGVAQAMGLLLLGCYFCAGLYPANVAVRQMVLWGTPILLMRIIVQLWLQRFNPQDSGERGLLMRGRLVGTVVWPIYLTAFVGVVRGRRISFKVTPKGSKQGRSVSATKEVRPHVWLGLIAAGYLVAAAVEHRNAVTLMMWAGLSTVSLLGFAAVVQSENARRQTAEAITAELAVVRERGTLQVREPGVVTLPDRAGQPLVIDLVALEERLALV